MRVVHDLLKAAEGIRHAGIKSWSRVSQSFLSAVAKSYPHLVEANIRNTALATVELLENGTTRERGVSDAQFPTIGIDGLDEPAFRALYEVGAIRLDPAGNPAVEPGPAALFRGLSRLALPPKHLIGVVNAARRWRGHEALSEGEFEQLDNEFMNAVRNGFERCLGDKWAVELNRASYVAGKAFVLPCTPLRGSQEFYEEGVLFYQDQGSDATIYVFSTTSGLVVPREFHGDASKNHYRSVYFTKGILGDTAPKRVYQWERYRTAKELAVGYERASGRLAKARYRQEAVETLGKFSSRSNLAIFEVDRFSPWKEWNTLVGPVRQQISIRAEDMKGKIGHGVIYDIRAFRARKELIKDAADLIALAGAAAHYSPVQQLQAVGPAVALAAVSCKVASTAVDRVADLVRKPLLPRCAEDQLEAHTIKGFEQRLTEGNNKRIVDDLLEQGRNILLLEKGAGRAL